MMQVTEESQLRAVEESLVSRFSGLVPQARIVAELETCRAAFAGARIRTFVPVLIQREAAERLRRLPPALATALTGHRPPAPWPGEPAPNPRAHR